MHLVLATVVVFLLASSLAVSNGRAWERISNGVEADEGEFPYLVSITYNDEHICGGFIYSNKHVITAASCVIGRDPWSMAVIVAQLSLLQLDPYEKRLQVVAYYAYPTYNQSTKFGDVAIVELSPLITYGPYVNFSYYEAFDETITTAIFAGWGAQQDGGNAAVTLRKLNVTIPSNCLMYGSDEYMENYMICAGDNTIDAGSPCNYDEGSPLVQGNYVIGIMSKNRGCTGDFLPTIYTRLSAFYVWIRGIAGQQPIPR